MQKIKKSILNTIVTIYNILPFKKFICLTLRPWHFVNRYFYKKLRFHGIFKVKLSDNKVFKMHHNGCYIENELFWKGAFVSWERDVGWIWQDLCKCSDVVFDIGANTGVYSLITKCINPNVKVIAFEPSFNTQKNLQRNIELNDFNIIVESIAISNKTGEQIFYDTPAINQTSASLSPDILKNFDGYKGDILEYKVPSMTLSHYIESHSIDRIDLMKIDIEMHESEAIEGFGDYLYTFKPIVILEILTIEKANELNTIIDFNQIKVFHLKKSEQAKQLDKFEIFQDENNYILIHNDSIKKIREQTCFFKNISK